MQNVSNIHLKIMSPANFVPMPGKLLLILVPTHLIESKVTFKAGDVILTNDDESIRRNMLNVTKIAKVIKYTYKHGDVVSDHFKQLEREGKFGPGCFIILNRLSGTPFDHYNGEELKWNEKTQSWEVDTYNSKAIIRSIIASFDDIFGFLPADFISELDEETRIQLEELGVNISDSNEGGK